MTTSPPCMLTLRIIHGALIMGLVLFMGVGFLLEYQNLTTFGEDRKLVNFVIHHDVAAIALALLCIAFMVLRGSSPSEFESYSVHAGAEVAS